MDVESWCAVECTANQNYTRATRKHYNQAFKSSVFSKELPNTEGRVDWSMADKPDNSKLSKRKHFPQKSKEEPMCNRFQFQFTSATVYFLYLR